MSKRSNYHRRSLQDRPVHKHPHPKAGRTVTTREGQDFHIVDWFDRAAGATWMHLDFDIDVPVCQYAFRRRADGLPIDNKVILGTISGNERLIHSSEVQRTGRALTRYQEAAEGDEEDEAIYG